MEAFTDTLPMLCMGFKAGLSLELVFIYISSLYKAVTDSLPNVYTGLNVVPNEGEEIELSKNVYFYCSA